jgi:predicted DNA-binding protein with PD1-like motif
LYNQVVGSIGRVVLAHFDKDEDVLAGIKLVLREQGLRSGYIPTVTGQLAGARLQRFPEHPTPVQPTVTEELAGPLECSGSGLFGVAEAPEEGTRPFALSGNVHGDPYVHVHLTVTSRDQTISGHLMTGTTVNSFHPVSHFTVFLVEVVGAELQVRCDAARGRTSYHHLEPRP